MKPYNIFLIRHGESVGNVDKSIYAHTPDWMVPLTEKGHQQAEEAAQKLLKLMDPEACYVGKEATIYCSPWIRARQTAEHFTTLLKPFSCSIYTKYYEDPRLREQEWGHYQPVEVLKELAKERDRFGTFFYRLPNGESGADVFDRISTFLETMHRDFNDVNYPRNVMIFSHGLTIRCFLMRFFHYSVEEYEQMRNPKNGSIIHMQLSESGRYELKTKLQKYEGKKEE
jgi:broad specificity phosphatase PhoE